MRKLFFYIMIFATCSVCNAQNLVPNGDFENFGYIICGFTMINNQFNNAGTGWTSPNAATPDFHSTLIQPACSNFHPNSLFIGCSSGSQVPHSGNIFTGIYSYVQANSLYREYIQTQLTSPMIPGKTYNVELYVSLGDNSKYATNNIGVGFSTSYTYISNFNYFGYVPQVNFTNVITDSINWVLLSATVVASQPYEYIIIGNYFDDLSTSIVTVNLGACSENAYYYIDDVIIEVASAVSMTEIETNTDVNIYPNPVKEKLNIKVNHNYCIEFILYDATSRILLFQSFINSASINAGHLAKGIYFYELRNENGVIKKGKLVKD